MADALALIVAVVAGVVAGFVNTLAGSGSFLTLPALVWLGLPTQAANATNRVGILIAAIVAVRSFPEGYGLPRGDLGRLLVPCSLGALLGAVVAARLDPRAMDVVVGLLMLAMLALILLRPDLARGANDGPPRTRGAGPFVTFLAIGAYGGFIQAGVGLFLLAGLVAQVGLSLRRANAVKLVLVLVFTVPAFAVFALEGQIVWSLGLLMAAGQALGAWLAARFATRSPRADQWIRRLLVVVLTVTAARLLLPSR